MMTEFEKIIRLQLNHAVCLGKNRFILTIGDFSIKFITPNDLLCELDDFSFSFLCDNQRIESVEIGFAVEEFDALEIKKSLSTNPLFFLLDNEKTREIYFYNYKFSNQIIAKLIVNKFSNKWKILFLSTFFAKRPLLYPYGTVIMIEAAFYFNRFFMHAAGIAFKSKGILISGFSGRGKSTLSGIFKKSGANVLNDDRMIINTKNLKMYNHPMLYTQSPESHFLDAIFFISHGNNQIKKLDSQTATMRIYSEIIFPYRNSEINKKLLFWSKKLAEKLNVYDFAFRPDSSAVDVIEKLL